MTRKEILDGVKNGNTVVDVNGIIERDNIALNQMFWTRKQDLNGLKTKQSSLLSNINYTIDSSYIALLKDISNLEEDIKLIQSLLPKEK